jgi:dihydrofolate reductase
LNAKGFNKLYIDGGRTVQSFIDEDLIDEMIITVIPVLLGEGIPLFGNNGHRKHFELKASKIYLNQIVQLHYRRKRV